MLVLQQAGSTPVSNVPLCMYAQDAICTSLPPGSKETPGRRQRAGRTQKSVDEWMFISVTHLVADCVASTAGCHCRINPGRMGVTWKALWHPLSPTALCHHRRRPIFSLSTHHLPLPPPSGRAHHPPIRLASVGLQLSLPPSCSSPNTLRYILRGCDTCFVPIAAFIRRHAGKWAATRSCCF